MPDVSLLSLTWMSGSRPVQHNNKRWRLPDIGLRLLLREKELTPPEIGLPMTKGHTDAVSKWVFYLFFRRDLLPFVLITAALIVSGCGACGSKEQPLLTLIDGDGSSNAARANGNELCLFGSDIERSNNDINRSSIPRTAQTFDITITGEAGLEGFPPRSGLLVVQPPVRPTTDIGLNNEPNIRDVAFFSGNPLTTPEAGAISFATNTDLVQQFVNGTVPQGLAAVDVAFVSADPATNTLTITIDGEFPDSAVGANARLNVMSTSSGDTEEDIFKLVGGTMTLEFAGNSQTVTGNVVFTGVEFNTLTGVAPDGTPVAQYQASISGQSRSQ
jgi:hypothetical protein